MRNFITKELKSRSPYKLLLIYGLSSCILFMLLVSGRVAEGSQQFSELANAFVHGQANFMHPIGSYGQDPINYHGKIYWGEGPFPAVVLMPFVAIFNIFNAFFYQGYIEWVFILGVIFFVYKLARIFKYSQEDSALMSLAFTLGTVFIGIIAISSSWFFAQVLATFLIFWSLYEFYSRRRWWLIGSICAAIMLTRITASPIILFFLFELWVKTPVKRKNLKIYAQLLSPVVLGALLIGLYNLVRFDSPLNGGFAYQTLYQDSSMSRAYGIFSIKHIPANLYSLIFRSPDITLISNNSWSLKFPFVENNTLGMSMFITSPYLLVLFTYKWSSYSDQIRRLILATGVCILFVLTYYGIGLEQFGTRYSLDFLPELFVVFMVMYKKHNKQLSGGMRFLLIASGLFNMYLLVPFLLHG
jgi:hypothetical protein